MLPHIKCTDSMEVETISSDSSSSDRSPKTSTPTGDRRSSTAYYSKNHPTEFPDIRLLITSDDNSDDDNGDDDPANTSKESDELTDVASLLNQSGCELVGINDNSDPVKNSPRVNLSKMSNSIPPDASVYDQSVSVSRYQPSYLQNQIGFSNKDSLIGHERCQERISELEKSTSSLSEELDLLKTQIINLTTRVFELEIDRSGNNNNTINNNNNFNSNTIKKSTNNSTNRSYAPPTPKYGDSSIPRQSSNLSQTFSRSISNVNRSTIQNNSSMPASSRRNLPSTPRQVRQNPNSQATLNNRYKSSTQLYANSNSSPNTLMKSNIHASMSSLHPNGARTGGVSASPTHTYQRQSVSPTSLMSLISGRDTKSHASMLSLSSMAPSVCSLRKNSPTSGSVSNLSQVGNKLSSWLSMSDFLTSKEKAKEIYYDATERIVGMVLYGTSITMPVPSWVQRDFHINKVVEPPSVKLKLDWVHGYRGRDCRSNIYHLPTGECVYFVASIIVLYNIEEKKQRHYLGHTDNVKCLAVHPNKVIIASGQSTIQNSRNKRPIVRVWNTVNLTTLRIIGFNEDLDRSICCLAFSKHDQGATLAVVDESNEHTITLLDWQREKNWRLAETNSGHEPVLAIDFHPIDKYSLVAVGKSTINFWDTRGMSMTKKAGLFDKYDKPKYVLCLTFSDLGETITGDSNGNIIIWPNGSNRPRKIIHDAHVGGVFTILPMKDGQYLTGGRDGRIVEWDQDFNQTGRETELPEHLGGVRLITYARGMKVLVGTLRNSILQGSLDTGFELVMQGHSDAVSCLAIHPNQCQFLTGGFDEYIHLFEASTHDVLWSKPVGFPVTAACFSPNGYYLIIGSVSGKWLVLDAVAHETLHSGADGSGTISCIKFSPNGELLALGSSDAHIHMYEFSNMDAKCEKVGTCVGHTGPIKELDWSTDSRYVQSQSMNLELLYWTSPNCRPLSDQNIIENLKWSTQNCTIGFNVIGLWSDSIDSVLVNCCDKSNNESLMVSATNGGSIYMYRWPPCYDQCLPQKYNGNVDKFNFIKFLKDDSRLIAVGAKSCVTTEWTIDHGDHIEISERL